MLAPQLTQDCIRQVSLAGGHIDPLLARLRLERALAGVGPLPPGLPPAAILCVRRLPDPRPGALDLESPTSVTAWAAELRADLGRLADLAARPAHASADPDAPAVLFADEAELLACLARDWAAGLLTARWWWRSLLGRNLPPRPAPERWLAAPQATPPALALLLAWGAAVPFLAALTTGEARAIVRAVVAAYGLPEPLVWLGLEPEPASVSAAAAPALRVDYRPLTVHRRPQPPPAPVALPQPPPPHRGGPPARVHPDDLSLPQRAMSLAAAALGPANDQLAPAARALLGVCLLARAPHPYLADLARFLEHNEMPCAPGEPFEGPASCLEQAATQQRGAGTGQAAPTVSERAPAARSTTRAITAAALPLAGKPPPRPDSAPADLQISPPPRAHARSPEQAAPLLPRALRRATVGSAYGGLFFLLNLARYLGLYADFTRPREPGLALSPWDLLDLLGRRLLPGADPDDPIWALLAELAGRSPEQPPGVGFEPPAAWHAPPDWLAPFGAAGPWRLTRAGGRLVALHPAGFVAVDLPGQIAATSVAVGAQHAASLQRWAEHLAGYARARLALALGCAPGGVAAALALPAWVEVGPVRIDVVMKLASLPVELRSAGLDRDIGWLPEARRDIRFHFE